MTGKCNCKSPTIVGHECGECEVNHYAFPTCGGNNKLTYLFINTYNKYMLMILECGCHEEGSLNLPCEQVHGQCSCKPNVEGLNCNTCKDNYWNFPDCERMY